ncbi:MULTISPECIES: hypothetical protein [unclassified Streptomyces]|uniref:hypothetical protein n=1 Tax=unclassified Streptomyces TaxID=2593676 RepID=UPI002E810B87|nr:hypothetical protein [Streptomyces sp. NBC_00589]WTI33629.1 hypothetical protein OIC96_00650 [Streptomyces sp. NBC_00775]WUB32699.1 hypothetical protein OHA51_49085 [Streptomyces sp. NBC_00589]
MLTGRSAARSRRRPGGAVRSAALTGFSATDLNGHQGTQSVEEGAAVIAAAATAGPDAPSAAFVGTTGTVPW